MRHGQAPDGVTGKHRDRREPAPFSCILYLLIPRVRLLAESMATSDTTSVTPPCFTSILSVTLYCMSPLGDRWLCMEAKPRQCTRGGEEIYAGFGQAPTLLAPRG
jgi:hypothetical protein